MVYYSQQKGTRRKRRRRKKKKRKKNVKDKEEKEEEEEEEEEDRKKEETITFARNHALLMRIVLQRIKDGSEILLMKDQQDTLLWFSDRERSTECTYFKLNGIFLFCSSFSMAAGLERLQDKCLVHISQENIVSIHGIVQITAWEIVRQEYIEDSGKQIQLQGPNEICQSLDDKLSRETIANFRKGTCSSSTDLYLHPGPEYLHNGQRYDDLTNYTPEFSEQLSPETFANFSKGTCSIPTDPNLHIGPESLHNGKRYGDLANYTPEFSLEQCSGKVKMT
ncbi:hypothetical protein Ahy_A09g045554 [Arachis hypogaea]|uniref:Uncharacterized protein n=1 Tax=Arachis hypogaea TaxID=3818 RepID=A0A445BML9_ARAHY|nr:hypothetical protein Ahy_A09g045554 [Arachis hypogaea]